LFCSSKRILHGFPCDGRSHDDDDDDDGDDGDDDDDRNNNNEVLIGAFKIHNTLTV